MLCLENKQKQNVEKAETLVERKKYWIVCSRSMGEKFLENRQCFLLIYGQKLRQRKIPLPPLQKYQNQINSPTIETYPVLIGSLYSMPLANSATPFRAVVGGGKKCKRMRNQVTGFKIGQSIWKQVKCIHITEDRTIKSKFFIKFFHMDALKYVQSFIILLRVLVTLWFHSFLQEIATEKICTPLLYTHTRTNTKINDFTFAFSNTF